MTMILFFVGVGGFAANPNKNIANLRNRHSERSEESPNFNRTPMF
jgi:hypothetical protein